MVTVELPFIQAGPIDVKVYVEDVEKYEDAEKEAIGKGRLSAIVRCRADFVQQTLSRSLNGAAPVNLKLTVDQVDYAFWAMWRAAQGKGPDPLE